MGAAMTYEQHVAADEAERAKYAFGWPKGTEKAYLEGPGSYAAFYRAAGMEDPADREARIRASIEAGLLTIDHVRRLAGLPAHPDGAIGGSVLKFGPG